MHKLKYENQSLIQLSPFFIYLIPYWPLLCQPLLAKMFGLGEIRDGKTNRYSFFYENLIVLVNNTILCKHDAAIITEVKFQAHFLYAEV